MDNDARNDLAWNTPRRGSGYFGPRHFFGPATFGPRDPDNEGEPEPEDDDDGGEFEDSEFDVAPLPESNAAVASAIILFAAATTWLGVAFGAVLAFAI